MTIAILVTWFFLAIIFIGIGAFYFRLLSVHWLDGESISLAFWIGWITTIGILQIWHLFLPVNNYAFLLALGLSGIGWIINIRPFLESTKRIQFAVFLPYIFVLALIGLYVANRSTGPVTGYDTALYYQQELMWNRSFPIIPGLGLLHPRFAFNNSNLLYSAMIDRWIWTDQSFHISTGILVMGLASQSLRALFRLICRKSCSGAHILYALFLLPPLTLLDGNYFVSNSSDLAIFFLGVVLVGQVFQFMSESSDYRLDRFRFNIIAVLATAGITVKLSFAITAVTALLITLWIWLRRYKSLKILGHLHGLIFPILTGAFLVIPWVVRNVILSGYLVFPNIFGGFPVIWRIPEFIVYDYAAFITSWARNPGLHWSDVLFDNYWLTNWIRRFPEDIIQFIISLLLMIPPFFYIWKKRSKLFLNRLSILILPISSLIFWFAIAPEPRFAGANLWIFLILSITINIEHISFLYPKEIIIPILTAMALTVIFIFYNPINLSQIRIDPDLAPIPEEFVNILKNRRLQVTESGLSINLPPSSTDQCWTIPLPCTPYFDSNLKLIKSDQLSSGFMYDSPPASLSGPILSASEGFTNHTYAAINFQSGFYPQEAKHRWMHSPGKISLISVHNETVQMRLIASSISDGQGSSTSGILNIYLDGRFFITSKMEAAKPLIVKDIRLSKGVHALTFEVFAGNSNPSQLSSDNQDSHSFAIDFSTFEFSSMNN